MRELLELALAQMRDYAVMLLDANGHIVAWLGGSREVFGYEWREVEGQHVRLLFLEEDVQRHIPEYELELARHHTTAQDDRYHLRKDGSRIWVAGTVTAITGEGGELRGYVKVVRDRTDQRIGAEERANRLARAEEAIERTTEFVRRLGHELRNPLAPIKNSAFILPRISPEPRVAQIADTIRNQTAVLERLASDLMDVARLEQRKVDLRLMDVDVCALLRDEAVAHSVEATRGGVHIDALLPHRPVIVKADPARLRQAIGNLVGNAIKYTPPGGRVWIKAVEEAGDVAIKVQDTGIGIAPEMLTQIFELFTQESRASQAAPGGLGIGLAIVREIAQLHGGVVQARSSGIGKGAEFTLRLPRDPGGEARPE